jgi:hypothetical protein
MSMFPTCWLRGEAGATSLDQGRISNETLVSANLCVIFSSVAMAGEVAPGLDGDR